MQDFISRHDIYTNHIRYSPENQVPHEALAYTRNSGLAKDSVDSSSAYKKETSKGLSDKGQARMVLV